MKKITQIFFAVFIFIVCLFSSPSIVLAIPTICDTPQVSIAKDPLDESNSYIQATFKLDNDKYKNSVFTLEMDSVKYLGQILSDNSIIFNLDKPLHGSNRFFLKIQDNSLFCNYQQNYGIIQIPDIGQGGSARTTRGSIQLKLSSINSDESVSLTVSNLPEDGLYSAYVAFPRSGYEKLPTSQKDCKTSANKEATFSFAPLDPGTWGVEISEFKSNNKNECSQFIKSVGNGTITMSLPVITPPPTPTPKSSLPPCAKWVYSDGTPIPAETDLLLIPDKKCVSVATGLGTPIGTEPQTFIQSILGVVLSLSGGIALLLIISSGYKIITSSNNEEALKAGREQLLAAIVGLLFIIFSVVLLQIIGVDILKIPGFKK